MERVTPKPVKLYVMEHQEIFTELYKTIVPSRILVELVGVTAENDPALLCRVVEEKNPDVCIVSVRRLEPAMINALELIKTHNPRLGMVILLLYCNAQDMEILRRLALIGSGGMALFLKQSLDQIDQLCQTIMSVSQGQVILDPPLASYMFAGKPESPFLKQLTARELEILGLLSNGYTNAAIAGALYIDIKTVEHHLNSLYSKLKADPVFSDKHLRVSAARLYLETVGDKPPDALAGCTPARYAG